MDGRKGYLLALLCALADGFIPGFAVSAGTAAPLSDQNVVLSLLGFAASTLITWVGAPLGVWGVLALGKQRYAGRTALLLIAVLLLSWIAMMPIMVLTPLGYSGTFLMVLSLSVAVLTPLVTRPLATWWRLFSVSA